VKPAVSATSRSGRRLASSSIPFAATPLRVSAQDELPATASLSRPARLSRQPWTFETKKLSPL
jgi:hypothetical protein